MLSCHIFLMNCKNISIVNKINILTKFAYLEDFTDCAISREINSSYLHLKETLRRLKMAAKEAEIYCWVSNLRSSTRLCNRQFHGRRRKGSTDHALPSSSLIKLGNARTRSLTLFSLAPCKKIGNEQKMFCTKMLVHIIWDRKVTSYEL